MNPIGLIIGILFSAAISSILIWVAGMLGLGLEVDGFGPALIAGIAIALVGGVITWLMSLREIKIGNEIVRFIINALMGGEALDIQVERSRAAEVQYFLESLPQVKHTERAPDKPDVIRVFVEDAGRELPLLLAALMSSETNHAGGSAALPAAL